jgi:hypothetical protein
MLGVLTAGHAYTQSCLGCARAQTRISYSGGGRPSAGGLGAAPSPRSYIKAANTAATYVVSISAIINAVAAWHYNEIVKVRTGQAIKR